MAESSPRVLVVEDEAIVALDIRSQLEQLGYVVVGTAATAGQACRLADELQPDLVMMDIHLQGEADGIDAAAEIRRRRPVPVVFLTAYADSDTVARAKGVEPYGYLVKPFNESDLRTTIEIALHKDRTDRAVRQSRDDLLTILDVQRQGTLLVNEQEQVTFLSRAAQEMLNVETENARGRHWRDVLRLSPAEARQVAAELGRAGGRRRKVPVALGDANDARLHVEIEVQDDPRDADRKILFLYDMSDVHRLRRKLEESASFEGIVGKSDSIRQVVRLIEDLGRVDSTVLIEGESGTGKELVAQAIHQRSGRREEQFLPLNCAGLSEELAASQLFGHAKGAFTGAVEARPGLFEAVGGGTLFLDEIGELPPRVQSTLLRVLEEKAVMRLGETKSRPVNPRIIVASNLDLATEAAEGRFRADLLYRIRVARVCLPPLRKRREDIPLLVATFLAEHRAVTGKDIREVSDAAMSALITYDWPGNVRELKNVLEFAVIRAAETTLQFDELPEEVTAPKQPPLDDASTELLGDKKARILAALERAGGNRKAAAKILGIGRATLYRHLANLGITDDQ